MRGGRIPHRLHNGCKTAPEGETLSGSIAGGAFVSAWLSHYRPRQRHPGPQTDARKRGFPSALSFRQPSGGVNKGKKERRRLRLRLQSIGSSETQKPTDALGRHNYTQRQNLNVAIDLLMSKTAVCSHRGGVSFCCHLRINLLPYGRRRSEPPLNLDAPSRCHSQPR